MQQIDFSQGSIRRRILAVATPMLIAQLLNLLYNIVDRIYIGKIPGEGTLALASIGLCFPFVTLITAFANLFGLGGAPLCAMARGKGNRESAQGIMVNAGFMLLLSGAVLTVLGIAMSIPVKRAHDRRFIDAMNKEDRTTEELDGAFCFLLGDEQYASLMEAVTEDDGTQDDDALGYAYNKLLYSAELKNF